jgi:hypothetical protein
MALYFNKLEFPSPKHNIYQVGLNMTCWLRRFVFSFQCIFIFSDYFPLENGIPFYLMKLKSPPSKNDLCKVWLKLAQWFWRKTFLNDPTTFFFFCDYLPFQEDLALYLNKLEFPLPKDNIYQV